MRERDTDLDGYDHNHFSFSRESGLPRDYFAPRWRVIQRRVFWAIVITFFVGLYVIRSYT